MYGLKKRVLVTGGAGLIGSHLCERLLQEDSEVISVDSYFTGTRANLANILDNTAFEALHHDVTVPLQVEADEIYNLACPASPIHYNLHPVQTTRTSLLGAVNMLDLAQRTGAKIFQASTSEVYGDSEVHPQPEDYHGHVNPLDPRSCYDEAKRCTETLVNSYRRQFGMKVKIARLFITYGPRMNPGDGRVISNFITATMRGEPITLFGDGLQTRTFCYVDDMVDGMVRTMETPDDFTGPVNLGTTHEITIRELAEEILRLMGSSTRIEFRPSPPDYRPRRCPDITLAREKLGWEPKVSLEDGLRETIKYFRKLLG